MGGREATMLFSTIVSQLTGKVLDVPNGTSEHVPIQQFKKNPGPDPLGTSNQQWLFVPAPHPGDSAFEYGSYIVNRSTGQTLEVSLPDFRRDIRPLRISQGFLDPHQFVRNQTWSRQANENGDGSFFIFSMLANRAPSIPDPRAIDIPADGLDRDETQIQLFPFHGGPNQRWNLLELDIPVFAIFSRQNRMVMDVPAFNHGDGDGIQQNAYNGGSNQLWVVDPPAGQGQFHTIVSVCSDKVLQVSDDGTLVQAGLVADARNQQWELIPATNNSLIFLNRETEQALDSSVGDQFIRQNIPDGSANQEWWTREVPRLFWDVRPN
jgi:hypothetical protein